MSDFKVKRPKITIAGAVLGMICAVAGAVVSSLFLTGIMRGFGRGYLIFNMQTAIGTWIFLVMGIFCVITFIGAILILKRRYGLGGILVLIPRILLITSAARLWQIGLVGIAGGILTLISREKIPEKVLEISRQKKQVSIKEVAALTGKTELDVEVAIARLKSKGQPIRFEMKTREVIYEG